MAGSGPIVDVVERWHSALRGDLSTALDELLHDDCVFWSPVLFKPQAGKDLTKMYLMAAYGTFSGRSPAMAPSDGEGKLSFRYLREVVDGHDAVLEFESELDSTVINGADFIRCDDDGRIVDFKVMLRPLSAVNKMRDLMAAMLDA